MGGDSTESDLSQADRWLLQGDEEDNEPVLGLSLAWCLSDPDRVGEVALVPGGATVCLGRGEEATAHFVRIRPRGRRPAAPLSGRLLSRRQLEITSDGQRLHLVNVGSCALKVDGEVVKQAVLQVGQSFELDRQLVLTVVRRRPLPPELPEDPPFGRADKSGLVGESMAAWELRAKLWFLARRPEPVLVLGASGTGKELAARALHAGSSRSGGPFVSRNAATLPEGLLDAELFGNVRNYPNPGMVERPGLIGAADGGTLFLDEIGEMPELLQAHLLRVLDRDGEYQRLGEARTRRASFRFVAATNRAPEELKHDLLARLPLRVSVPGLPDRPEDVPLLIRHLLQDARTDAELASRLFEGDSARISPELVLALLSHPYTHHVRELQALLWLAIETSPGRALLLTPEVRERLSERGREPPTPDPASSTPVQDLDAEQVRQALESSGGSVTRAAKLLGLSSRYALYRLMRKYGLG
jgi:DNA-binding NtrC family response regulator